MEQNYDHLVGKKVRVNGEYDGIVAHIDPDVGFTIVAAENPELRLVCLVHPAIWASRNKGTCNMPEDVYTAIFQAAVSMFNRGDFSTSVSIEMAHKGLGITEEIDAQGHADGAPASACAFT